MKTNHPRAPTAALRFAGAECSSPLVGETDLVSGSAICRSAGARSSLSLSRTAALGEIA
jgi:hypothetical protein